jgi:hypothetical protein
MPGLRHKALFRGKSIVIATILPVLQQVFVGGFSFLVLIDYEVTKQGFVLIPGHYYRSVDDSKCFKTLTLHKDRLSMRVSRLERPATGLGDKVA